MLDRVGLALAAAAAAAVAVAAMRAAEALARECP